MKAADFALFGASWWPYAPLEELKTATCLAIWVNIRPISSFFDCTNCYVNSYLRGTTVQSPSSAADDPLIELLR